MSFTNKELHLAYKMETAKYPPSLRDVSVQCVCPACDVEFEEDVESEDDIVAYVDWLENYIVELKNKQHG